MEFVLMSSIVGVVCGVVAGKTGQKWRAGTLAAVVITICINVTWRLS